MTKLELAQQIAAQTKRIESCMRAQDDERLPALFDEREELISTYLELEASDQFERIGEAEERAVQEILRESYEINRWIEQQMQRQRQLLMLEISKEDQVREATNAYASPYENVYEPMFIDKKK
ncbi:hypothetical protein [Tumebacillus lipolyticus]|uniref:Flagellar protein FliT n=1 Tax=Tumebacillus lipolyticus TaxID=1280370 RepID=A0ABW4ZXT3_9BACL